MELDDVTERREHSSIKVGRTKIETEKQELYYACILSIEAGTNCPQGGDAGHGGVTVIRLLDEGGASMSVRIKLPYQKFEDEVEIEGLEIILRGDQEAQAIAELLQFAGRVIEEQIERNKR